MTASTVIQNDVLHQSLIDHSMRIGKKEQRKNYILSFCLMSSDAKEHIRDNKKKKKELGQLYGLLLAQKLHCLLL